MTQPLISLILKSIASCIRLFRPNFVPYICDNFAIFSLAANEGFASLESVFSASVRPWLVAFVRSEREVLTTAFILPTSVRAIIIFGRAASITPGAYFIMDERKGEGRISLSLSRTLPAQKVPPPESFVAKVAPPKRPTCDARRFLPANNFSACVSFFGAPQQQQLGGIQRVIFCVCSRVAF